MRRLLFVVVTVMLFLTMCGWDIGRHIGDWRMALAEQSDDGQLNTDEEIKQSEDALKWDPQNTEILSRQIELYRRKGDLDQALAKVDQIIELTPKSSPGYLGALLVRCDLLQALGRHQEALAQADVIVELVRAPRLMPDKDAEASVLNTRAYFIARAAAEGKATDQQKGQALKDMATVFEYLQSIRGNLGKKSLSEKVSYWHIEMNYLDTLAYLKLFSGDPKLALRDLNRCVEMCEYLLSLSQSMATDRLALAELKLDVPDLLRSYAVFLHHRGEALERLENPAAAQRDRLRAGELGYNKNRGLW